MLPFRELHEETTLQIDNLVAGSVAVRDSLQLSVGTNGGDLAYHVTSFIITVDFRPKPKSTGEIEPTWLTVNEAFEQPMGYGTRTILERIRELYC